MDQVLLFGHSAGVSLEVHSKDFKIVGRGIRLKQGLRHAETVTGSNKRPPCLIDGLR